MWLLLWTLIQGPDQSPLPEPGTSRSSPPGISLQGYPVREHHSLPYPVSRALLPWVPLACGRQHLGVSAQRCLPAVCGPQPGALWSASAGPRGPHGASFTGRASPVDAVLWGCPTVCCGW